MIKDRLATWAQITMSGIYTPQQAANQIDLIISQVRVAIAANPTTHINDIIP